MLSQNGHSGAERRAGCSLDALHARLRSVVGSCSIAEVARRTGFCAETARRYLNSSAPSVAFVSEVCREWNVNANWLLFGEAPEHGRSFATQVASLLAESDGAEILACQVVRPANGRGEPWRNGAGGAERTVPAVLIQNLSLTNGAARPVRS